MTTTHHLTRNITFVIDKDANQATICDGQRTFGCTVAEAKAYYRSLLGKGWTDPAANEREMQRMEAKYDREQTIRDETAKHAARARMERY